MIGGGLWLMMASMMAMETEVRMAPPPDLNRERERAERERQRLEAQAQAQAQARAVRFGEPPSDRPRREAPREPEDRKSEAVPPHLRVGRWRGYAERWRADDRRLNLPRKLRPPPGVDRQDYCLLIRAGWPVDEALELLRMHAELSPHELREALVGREAFAAPGLRGRVAARFNAEAMT